MTQVVLGARPFSVHARHVDRHQARIVEEASFEAAAVAFLEDFHPSLTAEPEISVVVRDVGSGHERCFRIGLEPGEAAPSAANRTESAAGPLSGS